MFVSNNLSALLNQPEFENGNGGQTNLENLMVDIALIKEDPNQPRKAFFDDSLKELAESIKECGVITPISIRPDSQNEGHFIVNHGARRLRASILAGKTQIPAIVHSTHTKIEQILENIQRENLKHIDLANAIDELILDGFKKGEIAQKLGKSKGWVSYYVTLKKAPSEILEMVEKGLLNDIFTIAELTKLYKKYENKTSDEGATNFDSIQLAIIESLENNQEFTRKDFFDLKETLGEINDGEQSQGDFFKDATTPQKTQSPALVKDDFSNAPTSDFENAPTNDDFSNAPTSDCENAPTNDDFSNASTSDFENAPTNDDFSNVPTSDFENAPTNDDFSNADVKSQTSDESYNTTFTLPKIQVTFTDGIKTVNGNLILDEAAGNGNVWILNENNEKILKSIAFADIRIKDISF